MTAASQCVRDLLDARTRTLALVEDLTDEQCVVPQREILNPPIWEIGHVAWFQERWTLRELGRRTSIFGAADKMYDSIAVHHDTRWELRLPSRADTLAYMSDVLDAVQTRLRSTAPTAREDYFHRLVTYHEDMHGEALAYTRQTLGYAAPRPHAEAPEALGSGARECSGDVEVPGGRFLLGSSPDQPFVFDNEKWAHEVEVAPFSIARAAVSQAEFAEFVEAGGYAERRYWCDAGWRWRTAQRAESPVYWERGPGTRWYRRSYDRVLPLEEDLPVQHVNYYEASAYCRWVGRRLPTEAEWEFAASAEPGPKGARPRQRCFPWGDDPPTPERAHLDARSLTCVPVAALPAGDSPFGCRQMIGNVWEWTTSDFGPYPGFVADPYKDYSEPWFRTRKVLRGGCHVTRSRMLRNTWRNFYTPDRRDVFAGFRTVASGR